MCKVRNWEHFQHYKDRNPPWVKLHFSLLTSQDWVMLDDASRVLAIACMLVASRNEGNVDCSQKGLAYLKRVAYLNSDPDVKPLIECGFLEVASDCKQMLANARPETETETEKIKDILSSSATTDREFLKAVLDAYHEKLPELPAVRVWNDRRRKKLRACIAERVRAGKPADTLEYWQNYFAKVAASDFLCGRGSGAWRADFEWLTDPKNFARVIEGRYDNQPRSH